MFRLIGMGLTAQFARRIFATLIDLGIVIAIAAAWILFVPGMRTMERECQAVFFCVDASVAGSLSAFVIFVFFYPFVFEYFFGCAVGKWVTSLRVRNEDGSKLTWLDATMRMLTHPAQLFMTAIPLAWPLFWMSWVATDHAQTFVDIATRTKVASMEDADEDNRIPFSSWFAAITSIWALFVVMALGFLVIFFASETQDISNAITAAVAAFIMATIYFVILLAVDRFRKIKPRERSSTMEMIGSISLMGWAAGFVVFVIFGISVYASIPSINALVSNVTSDPELLHTISGHDGSVRALAFSPDGSMLASSGSDRTVKLWDVNSGALIHTIGEEAIGRFHWYGWEASIAFSPDGNTLAIGGDDNVIRLWDVPTRSVQMTLDAYQLDVDHGTPAEIYSLAFSPDGQILATGGKDKRDFGAKDKTVHLWDVNTGELLRELEWPTDHPEGRPGTPIMSLAFSNDGQLLAGGSFGTEAARLWNAKTGELLRSFPGEWETRAIYAMYREEESLWVTFPPNDRRLLISGIENRMWYWEGLHISLQESDIGLGVGSRNISFSPDGKLLAVSDGYNSVHLWYADREIAWKIIERAKLPVFSPDGRTLATIGDKNSIQLWNIPFNATD